ncbi:MAG: DUF3365 domain-containing protein [Nitrospirae bacterium]|nr:DUF3365 domain-containing protein [Nitrospirota bacterium]
MTIRASQEPQAAISPSIDNRRLLLLFVGLMICWTLFIAGLVFWETRKADSFAITLAQTDAISTYNKDLAYRRWAARHGGVYVPITRETPSNPHLAHIPERDITTPSGNKLTLVNPAYMTRQVHELSEEQYGVQGHITSLNTLRTENAPDEWEARALRAFEAGSKEVSSLEMIGNKRYMRLMRPMVTEVGCLKCHGHQGYRVGDIRGGISVSVPFGQYHDIALSTLYPVYWGYTGIWVVGIVGLWFAQNRLGRSLLMRKKAEVALRESEERFRMLLQHVPSVAVQGYRLDGTTHYWNYASERLYGYTAEEAIGRNLLELIIPPEMRDGVKEAIQQMAESGQPIASSELSLLRKDGSRVTVYSSHAIVQRHGRDSELFCLDVDLTKVKVAEEKIRRSLKEKEVMLKEIHHRVKNNMQVIYSLLNLQAKGAADETVRALFEESRDRVNSMALIHEKLYRSDDLAHIDFKDYLQSLLAGIASTYKRRNVDCIIEMEPIALDVNVGIPCGLIVNELVSNSLKHAFPDEKKGTVTVGVNRADNGSLVLTVSDNGIGFPEELDFRSTQSLGLQLVNVLAGQIHGTIELSNSGGANFTIQFPETSKRKGDQNG